MQSGCGKVQNMSVAWLGFSQSTELSSHREANYTVNSYRNPSAAGVESSPCQPVSDFTQLQPAGLLSAQTKPKSHSPISSRKAESLQKRKHFHQNSFFNCFFSFKAKGSSFWHSFMSIFTAAYSAGFKICIFQSNI